MKIKRLSFALRTLWVVVTVVAIAAWYWAPNVRRQFDERQRFDEELMKEMRKTSRQIREERWQQQPPRPPR
jgi:hypothetical protein